MILQKVWALDTVYSQRFGRIEIYPSQLQEIDEFAGIFFTLYVHTGFLPVAKTQHHFAWFLICAFNNVCKVFDIKRWFDLEFKATFVDDENLMGCQYNNTVNLLFTESIDFNNGLEVHDGVIWGNELFYLRLGDFRQVLYFWPFHVSKYNKLLEINIVILL